MAWGSRFLLSCYGLIAACSFDGAGSGGAATLGEGTGPGTESGDSASSNTQGSNTNSTTASDASASGEEGPNPNTSDSGPVTTGPGPTSDPTQGETSVGDSGSTTAVSATSGNPTDGGQETTAAQPEEEHLQNADQDNCNTALWCFFADGNNVGSPTGDETWTQECFTATLDPPFELTEVHWFIADTGSNPTALDLQIRPVENNGPGGPPLVIALPGNYSDQGEHTYVLQNPVQIDSTRFCVGFRAPSNGQSSGAVGFAVDTTQQMSGVSFIRIDGESGCDLFPDWYDASNDQFSNDGNWCLDVKIRQIL